MAIDNDVIDRALDAAEAKIQEGESIATEEASDSVEELAEGLELEGGEELEKEESPQPVKETKSKNKEPKKEAKTATPKNKKEAAPLKTDSSDQEASAELTTEADSQEDPPVETESIPPPAFWSAERKALFAKAPKELQEVIASRELELQQQMSRLANKSQRGETIEKRMNEVFEPHRAKLQMNGIKDPIEASERLLAWNEIFEKDPKLAISDLMRKNGLTPADFNDNDQQYVPTDPRVEQALNEAKAAKELAEQQQQHFQRVQQEQMQSQIEHFKNSVDSLGQPRRKFAEMYAPQISQAIEQIKQINPTLSLQEALVHGYEYVLGETRKALGVSHTPQPAGAKPPPSVDVKKS